MNYRNGSTTTQRDMVLSSGMTYADTQQFIDYSACNTAGNTRADTTAQTAQAKASSTPPQSTSRYFYAGNRRVLSQQDIPDQNDLRTHTQRNTYQPGTHRLMGSDSSNATTFTANGQPERIGQREYVWDALGRLTEVRQQDTTLARYRYSHRGERIGKTVQGNTTRYLYNETGQLSAELDAQGRITRQYLYLSDQPIAVIDSPQGKALPNQALSALDLIGLDAKTILNGWWRKLAGADAEQVTWLHPNHLGAPQAATDQDGQVVWRASYAPFGAAKVTAVAAGGESDQAFTLNLRLPGQYFDAETGLHYNRHRYYDPSRGEYLTPDPLGTPDGPNPYSYVRYNPLKYIDPTGLILFAFDGTGNSDDMNDPAMAGGSVSNVVEFLTLYKDSGDKKRYVSGVGTVHKDTKYGNIVPDDYANGTLLDHLTGDDPLYLNDMGGNYSGPARIDRMMLYIRDEADAEIDDNKALDIDIVGFSRGAAEARDFSNRIVVASKKDQDGNYWYGYQDKDGKDGCQKVNFRFMGLWDTVLSTNFSGTPYTLGIPSQFAYVAQAVALNEHRSSNIASYGQRAPLPHSLHWGGFPLQSIGAGSSTPGATRIERGFLGAHADIGGGFADNELSKVALAWMVGQASAAGVKMDESPITITASAVLHDKSNNIQTGQPVESCALCTNGEDRKVNGAGGATTTQRQMTGTGMTYADTQDPNNAFITYQNRGTLARYTDGKFTGEINTDITGTVNVDGYVAWLKLNGYSLDNLQVQR